MRVPIVDDGHQSISDDNSADDIAMPRPPPDVVQTQFGEYFAERDLENLFVVSSASEASFAGDDMRPTFRWARGELIGKGRRGKVYLALNCDTGEMMAVRQIDILPTVGSDEGGSRSAGAPKIRLDAVMNLCHPNVVQYLCIEETASLLNIFMEYVPGGSIASCLRKHGPFSEPVTQSFLGQILSGLEYLHSRGFPHGDLKADNVLVETNGVCKLSDFDIYERSDAADAAGAQTAMYGTVFWMAPEVVELLGNAFDPKMDIWSVGCVAHEMWTGKRPWHGHEAMAVLLHLYQTKQGPPLPEDVELSLLADDFRRKCFIANPDDRPSSAELRAHSYLELPEGWTFAGFK